MNRRWNSCDPSRATRLCLANPEPSGARDLWLKLAVGNRPSPNVWMDAYLAAFAIMIDAELVTFDRGFVKFQSHGLKLRLLDSV
jgi:predicted nucleic acid-binding protein